MRGFHQHARTSLAVEFWVGIVGGVFFFGGGEGGSVEYFLKYSLAAIFFSVGGEDWLVFGGVQFLFGSDLRHEYVGGGFVHVESISVVVGEHRFSTKIISLLYFKPFHHTNLHLLIIVH